MRASDIRNLPSRFRVQLEVEIPRLQPWGTVKVSIVVVGGRIWAPVFGGGGGLEAEVEGVVDAGLALLLG